MTRGWACKCAPHKYIQTTEQKIQEQFTNAKAIQVNRKVLGQYTNTRSSLRRLWAPANTKQYERNTKQRLKKKLFEGSMEWIDIGYL